MKINFEISPEIIELIENSNKTQISLHVLNLNEYKNLGKKINFLKEEIEIKMHKKDLKNVKSNNFVITIIIFTVLIIIIIAIIITCYRNRINRILNIIRDTVVIELTDGKDKQPKNIQLMENQQNIQPTENQQNIQPTENQQNIQPTENQQNIQSMELFQGPIKALSYRNRII